MPSAPTDAEMDAAIAAAMAETGVPRQANGSGHESGTSQAGLASVDGKRSRSRAKLT
jgi:hypothetical protein